jgi:hypothetical protein
MNKSRPRALAGFLVAPVVPALFLYLVQWIFVPRWEAEWGVKILVLFAYLAALVMGIPMYFVLRRNQVASMLVYTVLGAVIGLACYALFFGSLALMNWKAYPDHALLLLKNFAGSGVMAVSYGAVASMIFWLIAIRRFR